MGIELAGTQDGVPLFSPADMGHHDSGVAEAPIGGMPFQPDHCQALNKQGHACQAKPVKGDVLCYGHTRARDAE